VWLSIVDGSPTALDTEPVDRDNDGEGPRGSGRDLLSPPQGFSAHRRGRHFTYAMGRFGTAADGAMLFELRAIENNIAYSPDNFVALTATMIDDEIAALPPPAGTGTSRSSKRKREDF
jgi:hypothetical protein